MGKPQSAVALFRDDLQSLRKALGNRIRQLRQAQGWSQEEFADRAHVHRTFAGSLERGEKNVSFHALVLISRCLEVTLSELFAGLEAGEPVKLTARARSRSGNVRRDDNALDRRKLINELATLEQSLRTLKEITLKSK